jgi:hypothetical protein
MAVAGGVGAVTAAPATAQSGAVATGPQGGTVVEFRGRITQSGSSGETFLSYGFLTRLAGATAADLFADTQTTVGTALLTLYATGRLTARVLDQSVHALDIRGDLTVYQRGHAGADFDDPDSFTQGSPVARFDLTLQDVLAVFAPAQGIPTLTGDMRQTDAGTLHAGLSGSRFGRRGQRLRLFATGLGRLVDPVTLNAQLEIAGNWAAS